VCADFVEGDFQAQFEELCGLFLRGRVRECCVKMEGGWVGGW